MVLCQFSALVPGQEADDLARGASAIVPGSIAVQGMSAAFLPLSQFGFLVSLRLSSLVMRPGELLQAGDGPVAEHAPLPL
jgi:hypothetical protein